MKFHSTNHRSAPVSYEIAVRQGLAPDGGLYLPDHINPLPADFWKKFYSLSFKELATQVALNFLGVGGQSSALHAIVEKTLAFDAPLVKLEERLSALELFHGPTMAFKDFGARFLAATLGAEARKDNSEIVILVATSGDTGSAVAHGFFGVEKTKVVVLYPSGKVSPLQEMQMATLGGNVTALEVNGTFDDCQKMVKAAFGDAEVCSRRAITSANSINIARLLPQTFYYFRALQQIPPESRQRPVVVSVPSGNFGNLTAGLIAKRMGLAIDHFVAATNANDVVPQFLKTSEFNPRPSKQTLSNAMDVGNPSNFARMMELFNGDVGAMQKMITGYSFTDRETINAVRTVFDSLEYLLDPHAAVGYLGVQRYLSEHADHEGIFLATAHPAKFKSVIEGAIGQSVDLPQNLSTLLSGKKQSIKISNRYDELKRVLLEQV